MKKDDKKNDYEYLTAAPTCSVFLDPRSSVKKFSTEFGDFETDQSDENKIYRSVKLRATFRIKVNGVAKPLTKEFPLSRYCTEKDFQLIKDGKKNTPLRTWVAEAKQKAEAKAANVLEFYRDTVVTVDLFKTKFLSDTINSPTKLTTVGAVYDMIIAENEENGDIGNRNAYKASKSAVVRFTPNVTFVEINKDWIRRFVAWHTGSETTPAIYLRHLRAVFNRAIDTGIVSGERYPFERNGGKKSKNSKKYTIKKTKARKIALTDEQRDTLMSLKEPSMRYGVDFWKLSYYLCGLNMSDLASMRRGDINNLKLTKTRDKTKNTSGAVLKLPLDVYEREINEIVDRYGDKTLPRNNDDYVFPILSPGLTENQIKNRIHDFTADVNAGLKLAETKLKLTFKLRTYTARHTFARDWLRGGGTLEELQVLFGHKYISTTQEYCEDWLDMDQKIQTMKRVKERMLSVKENRA